MAYSVEADLLLGDTLVSSKVDKQRFVDDAAEEIDSKIGFIYELPLRLAVAEGEARPEPDDWTALPMAQQLLLKQMNNKLASGRLILTLDIAGEQTALHAYGLRLVTEAMNELMLVANQTVVLSAIVDSPDNVSAPNRTPMIGNEDEESAVKMFEHATMRPGESATWMPGAAQTPGTVYVSPYVPWIHGG